MTKKTKLSAEQIMRFKKGGTSQKKLAEALKVSQQTIIRWKKEKDPFRKRKRKPKDYGIIPELLRSCITKNNTITQNELADLVSKEIGQQITQKKISYILRKRLNYTYKKLTFHYTQLDEEKAKAFNEEIKPLLLETPFIALDECSFYPNLDPRFGYAFKGLRAINKKPSNQGEHYTLLFAVSNLKKNGINPIGNKKNILLMDNARIHHASKKRKEAKLPSVKEQMAKKNIEVRYIVPYAPMLNPTELCFNTLRKNTERQRSRNYEGMKLSIEKAVEELNKQDLSENFRHCSNYFDKKDRVSELVNIRHSDYANGKPLSRILINQLIQQRARLSGIKKVVSPHTFRRTFATLLNNKGAQLTTIQKLLGHSHITTTASYIHNSSEELYQDYRKEIRLNCSIICKECVLIERKTRKIVASCIDCLEPIYEGDAVYKKYPLQKRKGITELLLQNLRLKGPLSLKGFVDLEVINCRHNRITSLGLSDCQNLHVCDNRFTDLNFLNTIPNPEKLQALVICDNRLPPTDLNWVSRFVNLELLLIGNHGLTKNKSGQEIIQLDNYQYNLFYGSLKPLQKLKKLVLLNIRNTNVDDDLEYLPASITRFHFEGNKKIENKLREYDFDLKK
ncbi:15540_t:CDS:2 [Entrophospora sp. SA101]|nr:15540_t:CDS:2 [Entrophospora sp. SA101]